MGLGRPARVARASEANADRVCGTLFLRLLLDFFKIPVWQNALSLGVVWQLEPCRSELKSLILENELNKRGVTTVME